MCVNARAFKVLDSGTPLLWATPVCCKSVLQYMTHQNCAATALRASTVCYSLAAQACEPPRRCCFVQELFLLQSDSLVFAWPSKMNGHQRATLCVHGLATFTSVGTSAYKLLQACHLLLFCVRARFAHKLALLTLRHVLPLFRVEVRDSLHHATCRTWTETSVMCRASTLSTCGAYQLRSLLWVAVIRHCLG